MPSSSSSKRYTPGRYVRGSSSFFLFLRSFFFCLLLRTVFRWIPDGFFFFLLPVTTRRLRFCSYDGSSLHTARSVCRNCCCCCDFLLFLSNAMRWIDDSSEPLSNNKTVTDKMTIMVTLSIVPRSIWRSERMMLWFSSSFSQFRFLLNDQHRHDYQPLPFPTDWQQPPLLLSLVPIDLLLQILINVCR